MALPSAARLSDFYDRHKIESEQAVECCKHDSVDKIGIHQLSFSYDKKQVLFEKLNLEISKGDILLVKGPSGSGKTTLLSLILGLQKPQSGYITINSSKELALTAWSDRIGYVGPNPFLIEGTLFENLIYANSIDIDYESAWSVLENAELATSFREQGISLTTEFNEESFLSTGQRQRLAIARAWLRDPDVLILDEATANVDFETENKIVSTVAKLFKNKIVIVISHKDAFDQIATKTLVTGS